MSVIRRFVGWVLVITVVGACALLAAAVLFLPRGGMRHLATVGVDEVHTLSTNLVAVSNPVESRTAGSRSGS